MELAPDPGEKCGHNREGEFLLQRGEWAVLGPKRPLAGDLRGLFRLDQPAALGAAPLARPVSSVPKWHSRTSCRPWHPGHLWHGT